VIGSNTAGALQLQDLFVYRSTIQSRTTVCRFGCPDAFRDRETFSGASQAAVDAQVQAALAIAPALNLTGNPQQYRVVTLPPIPPGQGYVVNGVNVVLVGPNGESSLSTFAGPRGANPFLVDAVNPGNLFLTPYAPDLLGGAEIFGLLDGVLATDPFF